MVERQDGRVAQRRRTRNAIVEAATRLLMEDGTPTVEEVAAAAEVSRRTVYLHFPTFDQLLLDASLGALSTIETAGAPAGDVEERVNGLVNAVLDQAPETLPLGRQIVRLTVDPPVRRGFRRSEWIENALKPLRGDLTDEQHERLAGALAVLIGFESMIVMRDVRGADAETERRTITWAARALVDSMRTELLDGGTA